MRRLNLITARLGRILFPTEDTPPSRPLPPPPHNPETPPKQPRLPFPIFFARIDSLPASPIPLHVSASSLEDTNPAPLSLLDRQIQVGLPLEYTFPSPSYMKDLPAEPSPYPSDTTSYILLDSVDNFGSF